ncbi:hypothetical protein D6D90_04620 [Moraxella catarrhalis]|uniref:hypothetical protein n=1 Tax=Moraxella catarrhalis TaxID=480 RepID=UPI000EA902CA|nr:hypothetical protein [Moraxella catarrhalis]MPW72441.1 hypothetical protein [Moraxella catarrhalis]MPW79684.1 hypothetical protein [Moraxella catarrhalis]MPW80813.1 hypothetical protein [Moraxella catarrhalis]MPX04871.1 hypothetical protein [Moraxella catarrhalis]MPX23482.1 hypothetical protein [Moraxella catarrhalis]
MLVYSKQGKKVLGVDGEYRNPEYFEKTEQTDAVTVIGDYPHIELAYQAIGVNVIGLGVDDTPAINGDGEQTKAKSRRTPKAVS